MSEKEDSLTEQMPEKVDNTEGKLNPSEELSLYISFNGELKEEMDLLLSDMDERSVIRGQDFCILTFESPDERSSERENIETKLKGKPFTIADYKKSIRTQQIEEARRKIYVSGFNDEVAPEQIREVFSKFGEVDEIILLKSSAQDNKPYAFVKFVSEEDARKALEEEIVINDEKLLVEISRVRPIFTRRVRSAVMNAVMITNFAKTITPGTIRKEVESIGKVINFRFFRDHAIVSFRFPNLVEKAIKKLNGKEVEGTQLMVVNAPRAVVSSLRGFRRGSGRRGRRGAARGRNVQNENGSSAQEGGTDNGAE